MIRVENVPSGSRLVDSYPFSVGGTQAQATALKADGIDGLIGYLGTMNLARLGYVLAAGLGFMPVTKAGEYKDGAADELAQLKALSVPFGTTVWLDLEGMDAWNTPAPQLVALIEAWAGDITKAGYIGGLYVGAPQPLTGEQLYSLRGITRYWLGQGRCLSKPDPAEKCKCLVCQSPRDAYPKCGWCMRQDWHGDPVKMGIVWRSTGVLVDTNAVQVDHFNRLPTWMVSR